MTANTYLGTYTSADSAATGIVAAEIDDSGRLRPTGRLAPATDPSFLALAPDRATVYAVREQRQGRVVAFRVRPDGTLTELNSQPTQGSDPCHLAVHPNGRFLFAANYASGDVVVYPLGEGGAVREPCHQAHHSGSGPNAQRQAGPHVHQVVVDPSGGRLLAVDLGTDTVSVYDIDRDSGHLALRSELATHAGAGPRHLAFLPSGTRFLLINELDSTVTECGWDPATATATAYRTVSIVPESFTGTTLAAEIVVSPDGRYAFASNRGHDSLAVLDLQEGVAVREIVPAGVRGPRHMSLARGGSVLVVAGETSHTVQSFAVEAGALRAIGEPVPTPSPVCVLPVE
ncbi:lactonase family protein [Allosaccharopolyspora coralli]|uniref:lactonase family protein n=1 Tax=Allosaccharopolyspora coralli TaxID=2665642 RepID=UPI001E65081E|nr:lactonase family protein [Allosaccharopolyspora coralli]